MPKDKTFTDLMTKDNQAELDEILCSVMDYAKITEDEHGYSRDTVCEGLVRAAMTLAMRREDQRYFRTDNEIRGFYLWASQFTKRKFETYTPYRVQRKLDEAYGKDSLYLRDAMLAGWEDGSTKTKQ